ncbi:MAG: ribosomal protein S20 [Parcubacteria bacterium C7867-001]|nr:MAG: ribosomal protein S20 [Parcubacteria bacterium C7867-001]
MAITKNAKKAHRASLTKRVFNIRRKRALSSAVKDVRKEMSAEALSKAYQAIDKAAKRGVIKKNTANRKKARLAKALAGAKK